MDDDYKKVIYYYVLKEDLVDNLSDYNSYTDCTDVFKKNFMTLEDACDAIIPLFKENLEKIIKKASADQLYIPSTYTKNKRTFHSFDKFGKEKEKSDNEKRLDLSRLKLEIIDSIDNNNIPCKILTVSCPTQQRRFDKIQFYEEIDIGGKKYKRVDYKIEETDWEDFYHRRHSLNNPKEYIAEAEILRYNYRIVRRGMCVTFYKPGDPITI